jgi:hypothetical protein
MINKRVLKTMEVFAIRIAHQNGVIFKILITNYVIPKMELTALIILKDGTPLSIKYR